jgi:2-amino-4-hydroxy-6-hydroxymethyldihydropteridine diphosphokinase
MAKIILGIGSNKGDSKEIIKNAIEDLKKILQDVQAASLSKTAPVGITTQPDFLNTAISGDFFGEPKKLLEEIHRIEKKYGRDRTKEIRWGQRSLDIDILLFGDLIVNEASDGQNDSLEIPHPRLGERRFALEPLLELSPSAKDPKTGEYYHTICARLREAGGPGGPRPPGGAVGGGAPAGGGGG